MLFQLVSDNTPVTAVLKLTPTVNVTSSSTVVAALEAARDAKAPIILQASQGGAAYFAGKGVANGKQEASIQGAIAAAQ